MMLQKNKQLEDQLREHLVLITMEVMKKYTEQVVQTLIIRRVKETVIMLLRVKSLTTKIPEVPNHWIQSQDAAKEVEKLSDEEADGYFYN